MRRHHKTEDKIDHSRLWAERYERIRYNPSPHVAVRLREHTDWNEPVGHESRLFAKLAPRTLFHRLGRTDEPARKRPASLERPLTALDEQHLERELRILAPLIGFKLAVGRANGDDVRGDARLRILSERLAVRIYQCLVAFCRSFHFRLSVLSLVWVT